MSNDDAHEAEQYEDTRQQQRSSTTSTAAANNSNTNTTTTTAAASSSNNTTNNGSTNANATTSRKAGKAPRRRAPVDRPSSRAKKPKREPAAVAQAGAAADRSHYVHAPSLQTRQRIEVALRDARTAATPPVYLNAPASATLQHVQSFVATRARRAGGSSEIEFDLVLPNGEPLRLPNATLLSAAEEMTTQRGPLTLRYHV